MCVCEIRKQVKILSTEVIHKIPRIQRFESDVRSGLAGIIKLFLKEHNSKHFRLAGDKAFVATTPFCSWIIKAVIDYIHVTINGDA